MMPARLGDRILHRSGRNAALVVAVVSALVVAPGAAQARPDGKSEFTPGAPGIGDPYFPLDGNGGYNVRHYDLRLTYDPGTDVLTGKATFSARATQNLSSFNLDFLGLAVRSIEVDGRAAEWGRDHDELTVIPQRGIRDHAWFTTVVRYEGVPETIFEYGGPAGFFHTDDGALVIGQPHVADTWFPVNDHPIDKASYTIEITVPSGLEAISNGVLRSERTRLGSTTWTWEAKEPMVSYLAMMAIGEFDVRAYREDDLRFWDALDPDLFEGPPPSLGEVAEGSLARQGEITDFLEGYFGRYPFSAGGGIVDDLDELFFALENQTRPIYAKGFFEDPIDGDSVVVHEIAHQWVGDSLALKRWKHIWLNEGFAQYMEWLWSEREGLGTAHEIFNSIASLPADHPFWTLIIGDPGAESIFDTPIYFRGAMTLHALRLEVGDQDFFRIVRRWTTTQAGGHVTTNEFIRLAERISGERLDELFGVWLFTPEKPAVLDTAAARAAGSVAVDELLERMGTGR
jgi:aminopeptidase N